MPLGRRMQAAFQGIWRRQQLALANLTGNAFLMFVLYTWFSIHDLTAAEWVNSAVTLVVVGFCALWLMGATLAAFHKDSKETPFFPVLRRIHHFLPWALALVILMLWVSWLASVMTAFLWVLGLVGALGLLPFMSQAAGGGFSRESAIRVAANPDYWIAGCLLLGLGTLVPLQALRWFPLTDSYLLRPMLVGMRFGFQYVLTLLAWMTLASLVGSLGREAEAGALSRAKESARTEVAAPRGDQRLHGDAELPLQ